MKEIEELTFIANKLDANGLHKEADLIDRFLYRQAFVFSLFEKEAARALAGILNDLSTYSLISNPTLGVQTLPSGLDSSKRISGTVANRYLSVYEWLDNFLSNVLEPNLQYEEDNEYFQTLVEYTRRIRDALSKAYSGIASVRNEYEILKKDVNQLITKLNSVAINPSTKDSNTKDRLEDLKKEYYDASVDLSTYLKRGNIDLEQLEDVADVSKKKLDSFLKDQKGKGSDNLKSLFDNQQLVFLISKAPIQEGERNVDWYYNQARKSGDPQLGELALQYKTLRKQYEKAYEDRSKFLEVLRNVRSYLESIYLQYREKYANDQGALSDLDEVIDEQELKELFNRVDRTISSLSSPVFKKAQDLINIDQPEFIKKMPPQDLEKIEKSLGKIKDLMGGLRAADNKYRRSVKEYVVTNQELKNTVEKDTSSRSIKGIDWSLFEGDIKSLTDKIGRQIKFISDRDSKIKKFLESVTDSYKKVLQVLKI